MAVGLWIFDGHKSLTFVLTILPSSEWRDIRQNIMLISYQNEAIFD